MTRLAGAIALILLALQLILVEGVLRAQSFADAQHGLLVLRSGDVVAGAISRLGDRFTVTLADGGDIRLPVSLVDFQAHDIHDAYQRLAARADADSASQQLDLADWCLEQELYREASSRLLAATVLDPHHPGMRRIETRLWLVTHPADATDEAPPQKDPSQDASVQRAIESLPSGAAESFVSTVQPILFNRCASCHRPGVEVSFQLLRPLRGGLPPRTYTDRNLSAVLGLIDRDRPEESPLLTVPRRAHGGIGPIASTLDDAQLDKVANWINSLVNPAPVLAQGVALPREAVLWQPGAMLQGMTPPTAPGTPAGAATSSPQPTGAEGAPQRDPFDPEVFNRRYFGE